MEKDYEAKYEMRNRTKATDDEILEKAFEDQFKQKLKAETIRKLGNNKEIREWLKKFNVNRAQDKSLPEQWREAGLSPEQWNAYLEVVQIRSKEREAFSKEMRELALNYDIQKSKLEEKLKEKLKRTDSDLVAIIEMNFEQLSLSEQIDVEKQKTPSAREATLDQILLAKRQKEIAKLKGVNPKKN